MKTPDQLNAAFGLEGKLKFIAGKGGLVMIEIDSGLASATISTYAGQVLSYQPRGQDHDLFFMSDAAFLQAGKAIKGGVPVCWPWFGPDLEDKGRPAHGFVRNRQWEVRATADNDSVIKVILGGQASDQTREIWPVEFDLSIEITVGDSLEIALITRNLGSQPITITQGLHSYFAVGDITRAQVQGLEQKTYIDKLDNAAEKTQQGAVVIDAETDRIYLDVEGPLTIADEAMGRKITIGSRGSNSAVVWNPWVDTTARMADLADDDYQRMICVETTNAGPDQVMLEGHGEYRLVANFRID